MPGCSSNARAATTRTGRRSLRDRSVAPQATRVVSPHAKPGGRSLVTPRALSRAMPARPMVPSSNSLPMKVTPWGPGASGVGVELELARHAGHVARVGPAQRRQHQEGVLDAPRHRPQLVERPAQRHRAGPRHPSERWTQPGHPAAHRRGHDATAGLAAQRVADAARCVAAPGPALLPDAPSSGSQGARTSRAFPSFGRLLRRRRTLTWWRRMAFSMISSRRDRTASTATPAISLTELRGASSDHSRPTRPRIHVPIRGTLDKRMPRLEHE
jgi:hypothetical protein